MIKNKNMLLRKNLKTNFIYGSFCIFFKAVVTMSLNSVFLINYNIIINLQAQARCHRIGQTKEVKVYRLITRNSYEREMFDRASMKLGLDKAVLQSMGGDKAANPVRPS